MKNIFFKKRKFIVIRCLLLLCLLKSMGSSVAQTALNLKSGAHIYALAIGISDYQNEGIDKLDFAHKDAEAFTDYLKSKAGGEVPDSNIILLQNEKATYTAIYNALDWLLETCKENDVVYFYFSGHGDMENSTIYKLGFLISYNTPRSNYINNAVRIEDLNNYANTLSVKTKAKVILITDACHSGNLAGSDFKGNFLVGEQLKAVQNNEIRMASCASDQLSVEDKKWGGGRGVFSYYLVKGLTGLADAQKDGNVTLKEISNYLQTSLDNDMVLKQKSHTQTPVIKGKNEFQLAAIDKTALASLENEAADAMLPGKLEGDLKPLAPDASRYFFSELENQKVEKLFQFKVLSAMQASTISLAMLDDSLFLATRMPDKISMDNLKLKLKANPDALRRFNRKLVEVISARGQEIINLYLSGDEQEIERRRYYNSVENDYEVYAKMFEVALKLTDAKSPLATILNIKYHYFSGVALRIRIPLEKDASPLIEKALEFQNKALLLEENAAYIHNELGLLYKMKQDFTKAISSFTMATEIAPTWSIPWSNLSNIALREKKFDVALKHAGKAIDLQPDYSATYVNMGSIYEGKNNFLLAEEYHRKSIELNSRHYLPYERLGFVYLHTTQYALADSFFHEAAIRKQGFNITQYTDAEGDGVGDQFDTERDIKCMIPQKIADRDIMTYFVKGLKYFENSDDVNAETAFRKVIEMDPQNPLAFHYVGKIMWRQNRWQEVDIYLSTAIQNFLTTELFKAYCDSVVKYITNNDACIKSAFFEAYYNNKEDYFLLANAYEKWNHFSQAEILYEKLIKLDSAYSGSYYKLWNLHERLERYEDAEEILTLHDRYCSGGLLQLNAFYERVTKALPSSGHWHYRAGSFHYRIATRNADEYHYDQFKNQPDEEMNDRRDDFDQEIRVLDNTQHILGTNEIMDLGESISFPKRRCILYLQKADSFLTDNHLMADANAKIGDMFVSLHATSKAYPYYQKASGLQGNNAGIRLKLIDTYNDNYKFQNARKQLDTLLNRQELDVKNYLLLAKYKIHAAEFTGVDTLLGKARKILPYNTSELDNLYGRYYLMSKKYVEAVPFYTNYLKFLPKDASAMYTMARIMYVQGKQKESYEWLQNAVKSGFDAFWVLKYDAIWDKERNTSVQWQKITEDIKQRPFYDSQLKHFEDFFPKFE